MRGIGGGKARVAAAGLALSHTLQRVEPHTFTNVQAVQAQVASPPGEEGVGVSGGGTEGTVGLTGPSGVSVTMELARSAEPCTSSA